MFKPKKYYKDESFDPIYNEVNWKFLAKLRLYPTLLLGLGALIFITQVILPLIYFKTTDEISKPVSSSVLGVASGFAEFEFKELSENPQVKNKDTNISNTDRDIDRVPESSNVPNYFLITIPKLGINDALVKTNPEDLNPEQALGRYVGTALPGEVGNTFIYGHSVLPFFYNPHNYKTIFSTLGDLEAGDIFYMKYNNKLLTYKVESKRILDPVDVRPLEEIKPRYLNKSTTVLMTCWPAGTKSKRLLVNAVLTEY